MKKIDNLNDLEQLIGTDTVKKCFTEYMMLMIARNDKLVSLSKDLENMDASDSISAADLKSRLE